MDSVPRGTDGRRFFTAEFKREQIDRVLRGEVTASELSREIGVSRALIQRWKHLATKGAETAVGSNGDVVPVGELRAAQARIKELERLIGKQTVIEAEHLGLTPITTPAASPESNGMSEAFVNTLKRDYVPDADRSSAARLIEQVPQWMEDYNTFAPHSSLGMKTPAEFRREQRST